MKGMSLPINIIVIIAVAVLVLIAVAAFVSGSLGGFNREITLQNALTQACGTLKSQAYNCDSVGLSEIEVAAQLNSGDQPGDTYTLRQLCREKNIDTDERCLKNCGC